MIDRWTKRLWDVAFVVGLLGATVMASMEMVDSLHSGGISTSIVWGSLALAFLALLIGEVAGFTKGCARPSDSKTGESDEG